MRFLTPFPLLSAPTTSILQPEWMSEPLQFQLHALPLSTLWNFCVKLDILPVLASNCCFSCKQHSVYRSELALVSAQFHGRSATLSSTCMQSSTKAQIFLHDRCKWRQKASNWCLTIFRYLLLWIYETVTQKLKIKVNIWLWISYNVTKTDFSENFMQIAS